jgi:hypothetical protein
VKTGGGREEGGAQCDIWSRVDDGGEVDERLSVVQEGEMTVEAGVSGAGGRGTGGRGKAVVVALALM